MNEVLFVAEIILTFGAVVAAGRIFGKEGLVAWIAVAMVLANLTTTKAVVLFGFDTTLGTTMFASTFLATDILTEEYGADAARKGVVTGVCGAVVFIICSQIALMYIPSSVDLVSSAMNELFALSIRTSIASVVMCLLANLADVWLFDKIKQATGGKKLWLRNNVATIICNCAENFLFVTLAFAGVFPASAILAIAVSTSVIECILAVADTPFIYMSRSLPRRQTDVV